MFDLYSEIILDHYKNPHNKGHLLEPHGEAEEHNPLCGDKIKVELNLDANQNITEITWNGEGCAISQASTDMLIAELKGKPLTHLKELNNDFIYDLIKVPISPGRVKCALIGLIAAKKAAILAEHSANNNN